MTEYDYEIRGWPIRPINGINFLSHTLAKADTWNAAIKKLAKLKIGAYYRVSITRMNRHG